MGKRNSLQNGKVMNTQSIRKAEEKDIDLIHNILDMVPFKYNEEVPYDRSWIEQLVMSDRCLTLVYETEGEIKGFISGEKMVSGAIMIWFCAVKTEYQHSIIGIKLYNEFEKVCRETGLTAILAYGYKTSAGMLDRLNFYSNDTTYREFYKPLVDW